VVFRNPFLALSIILSFVLSVELIQNSGEKASFLPPQRNEFVSETTSAGIKPSQTFSIILPNLIHKSRQKTSKPPKYPTPNFWCGGLLDIRVTSLKYYQEYQNRQKTAFLAIFNFFNPFLNTK